MPTNPALRLITSSRRLLELQIFLGNICEAPLSQLARPRAERIGRYSHGVHWNQRGHILLVDNFVDDLRDADVAPKVRLLREQHRHEALLDVGQLRRQAVDGDDLDLRRIELREQRLRVERPPAHHGPAAQVAMLVADADDLGDRGLGPLDVEERADDLDAGMARGLRAHALDALLQVRRVLVAGEDGDLALAAEQLRELGHDGLAEPSAVDAVEREALRHPRLAFSRHHAY